MASVISLSRVNKLSSLVAEKIAHIEENALDLSVFQTRLWLDTWEDVYRSDDSLGSFYIILEVDGTPACFLRLVGYTKYMLKVCDFAGGEVSDFKGPVYTESGKKYLETADFWNKTIDLLDDFDVVLFSNVRESLMDRIKFSELGFHEKLAYKNYSIDLASFCFEGTRFRSKYVSKQVEKYKKLSNSKRLVFKVYNAYTDKDYDKTLELLFNWKVSRIIKTGAVNFFQRLPLEHFYRSIGLISNPVWGTQLSMISIDGEPAAGHLGFVTAENYYYVLPAFNSNFSKLSSGSLLLVALIDWSKRNGIKRFDFTIGSELYKEKWATDSSSIFFFEHPVSALGALGLRFRDLKIKLQNIRPIDEATNKKV